MGKRHRKFETKHTGRFLRVGRELITATIDDRLLWMVLIPVADNDGSVFMDGHHKKFRERVLRVSGGSTENSWSDGKWVHKGRLYKERMIPLVFLATTEQAAKIAALACVHYDQTEIQCFPLSDRVHRFRRAAIKETTSARRGTRLTKTISTRRHK